MHTRKFAASLVLFGALLVTAATARADSMVSYFTTATFDGGYSDPTHAWVDLGKGATLSYYYQGSAANPATASGSDVSGMLGQFVLTPGQGTVKIDQQFNLLIHQVGADTGTALVVGDLSGKLFKKGAAPVLLSFAAEGAPGTATIGKVTYMPLNAAFTQAGAGVSLTGRITAVPLPATAGVSALLLAGFAGWQFVSRRRAA